MSVRGLLPVLSFFFFFFFFNIYVTSLPLVWPEVFPFIFIFFISHTFNSSSSSSSGNSTLPSGLFSSRHSTLLLLPRLRLRSTTIISPLPPPQHLTELLHPPDKLPRPICYIEILPPGVWYYLSSTVTRNGPIQKGPDFPGVGCPTHPKFTLDYLPFVPATRHNIQKKAASSVRDLTCIRILVAVPWILFSAAVVS